MTLLRFVEPQSKVWINGCGTVITTVHTNIA